jgi:glycosyltransferase involved in cell wall biosynthesis
LKIVQIATSDIQGGAARAAYRLHQGLRLAGQESLVLSRDRKSDDPFVSALADLGPGYKAWPRANELWAEVQPHYIDTNRTELSNTLFSFPYPAIDLSDIEQIPQADVLNLHWVAWFQSAETIAALLELGKPVVWTLHDMAPFTGGCHYSAGCQNYQASCQTCPQLKDDRYGLPEIILENKRAHLSAYPNLTIVTPSHWLGDCARRSQVFGNHRVEVIPYGLDTNLFRPIAKNVAREYFEIPDDTIVLLFGADSNLEHRKGANLLLEALKKCCQDPTVKSLIEAGKVRILNFGYGFSGLEDLEIPVTALGHIDSDETLCHAYASATVLLLPSLEDNLPNLMLEAMSCGTPLITFAVGGMPDLVEDGRTGRLVPPFDINVFAEVITHSLTHPDIYEAMGLAARDKIVKGYSLEKQANEYLALYRELLANQRHNQPTLTASQDNGSGLSLLENQKVALVAIQAGQIALAKERKTALELNNKVIQTQTQVQATQAQLQTTQAQLQTTQAQLQTTQAQLQTTQAKLQTTQAQLQTTQAQLQTTQAEVEAMRSSKFWKMRQLWVDAKSYMGLDS